MLQKIIQLFIALFICYFIPNNLFSQNIKDDWKGWRGLEKEGQLSNTSIPVVWNDTTNIQWKTEIPGTGHSSPVVYGDSVYLTTAYQTKENVIFKNIIKYLIIAFILFFFIFYILLILWSIREFHKNVFLVYSGIIAFSFILGFVIYFSLTDILFSGYTKGDHITQIFGWIYSGMVSLLCIILSAFTTKTNNASKLFFFIVAGVFLAYLIYMRPSPDYYTLSGDNYHVKNLQKMISYFLIVLVFILLSFVIRKNKFNLNTLNLIKNNSNIIRIVFLVCLIGSFILGFYGIGIYRMIRYPDAENIFSFPVLDLYFRDSNQLINIIILSISLWIILYPLKNMDDYFYNSKLFSIGILLFGILIFIQKNYQTQENEYTRAVICLDKTNGNIKWLKEFFHGYQPQLHPDNSPATPTPIITENKIIAYFGTPGMVCLDFEGNKLWEKTDLFYEDIHGIGSSPLNSDGMIILLNDMPKSPYIVAIDINTGRTVWKKQRPSWEGFHGAHRTPLLKSFKGKKTIVTWGVHGIACYDMENGNVLWEEKSIINTNEQLVASIITSGDSLFLPDPNLYRCASFDSLNNGNNSEIWSINMKHKGPICSSPVLFDNLLFSISDNGYASCIDITKGEIKWINKLDGLYMASVSLIDSNLFFSNTSGLTTVLNANDVFIKVSENKLPEPIYASFAITHDQLFIRTISHVWCIKEK